MFGFRFWVLVTIMNCHVKIKYINYKNIKSKSWKHPETSWDQTQVHKIAFLDRSHATPHTLPNIFPITSLTSRSHPLQIRSIKNYPIINVPVLSQNYANN